LVAADCSSIAEAIVVEISLTSLMFSSMPFAAVAVS
jgi:hypothetical protein